MSSSFLKKLEKEKAAATSGGQGNSFSLIILTFLDSDMKEQTGDDEDMEDEE